MSLLLYMLLTRIPEARNFSLSSNYQKMERRFRDEREILLASGICVNNMYSDRDTKRPICSIKDPRANVTSVGCRRVLIRPT